MFIACKFTYFYFDAFWQDFFIESIISKDRVNKLPIQETNLQEEEL